MQWSLTEPSPFPALGRVFVRRGPGATNDPWQMLGVLALFNLPARMPSQASRLRGRWRGERDGGWGRAAIARETAEKVGLGTGSSMPPG